MGWVIIPEPVADEDYSAMVGRLRKARKFEDLWRCFVSTAGLDSREGAPPRIGASLLFAIDRTLVSQASASASSQKRFQKLSSFIVPFRSFSRFWHRSVWQA